MAPATPAPKIKSLLAAFTIASHVHLGQVALLNDDFLSQ